MLTNVDRREEEKNISRRCSQINEQIYTDKRRKKSAYISEKEIYFTQIRRLKTQIKLIDNG